MSEYKDVLYASCFILAFLCVLAGAGWRRLGLVLAISAVTSVLTALAMGWLVWKVGLALETGSGDWRGFGTLMLALFTGYATAALVFLIMVVMLVVTKKGLFKRAQTSLPLLGLGTLLFAVGLAVVMS